MRSDPNELLTELEAAKNNFGAGHAARIAKLLAALAKLELTDPHHLIRFHECLLFLRAFPHAPSQVPRVENLLDTFHRRIEKFHAANADMSAFDDFDTAGIAGTTMQDVLSFDVAKWLATRIPNNIDIAWDDYYNDYQGERSRGDTWPRFIPLLEEDAAVEADIPWSHWIDAATGRVVTPSRAASRVRNLRSKPLPWFLNQFAKLPLPARQQSELYDSLRFPLRWRLENMKLSRTRNWTRPRHMYFHDAPLIQRSEVSLAQELARPAPKLEKLSRAAAEQILQHVREVMFVRYRELYGTTLGDPTTMVRADLGRGVVIHLWGLPAPHRLPIRAYVCGYTVKNGVPIHYFEAIGLCEWIEVGFNVFYTYRQGETAWIYAQTLRCLHALTASTCISIYPYQIGKDNDEAIDSGAFWFYRKLGFRSGSPDLQKLCEREEKRIAANPHYRTPPRILRRLAEAHMFYELDGAQVGTRPSKTAVREAGPSPGPWDAFSTRNLGLKINRRMARDFQGDAQKIRQASTAVISRVLKLNPSRWTSDQKHALENWSLVLALIPDLARWTPAEKRDLIKIIRAKSAPNEMPYFRATTEHPRLRAELLRLGSKPV